MQQYQVQDRWASCPPGEIRRFVRRKKTRKRVFCGAQLTGGAVLGILLALTVTGWPGVRGSHQRVQDFHVSGMSCSEVRASADDFFARRLDDESSQKIRVHLAQCPHCAPLVNRMKSEEHDKRQPDKADQHRAQLPQPDINSLPLLSWLILADAPTSGKA